MDLDKLEKLTVLYQKGALSDAEFQREKQKLMDEDLPRSSDSGDAEYVFGLEPARFMCLMNLCLLLSFFGWLVSILLWVAAKNKSEEINQQGKNIANWLITLLFVYILLFLFMGNMLLNKLIGLHLNELFSIGSVLLSVFPFLLVGMCSFVFPIIGAVKSVEGIAYRYPALRLFK